MVLQSVMTSVALAFVLAGSPNDDGVGRMPAAVGLDCGHYQSDAVT